MSTSAQRQRIRAEVEEIAELQARMGQLFRRASVEPARVATDDIELEMQGVTSHRQYHAARDFMATVQPDIMHCVFAELARDHSHGYKWLFDMDQLVIHHRRRALTTTPFAVAGYRGEIIRTLSTSTSRWRTAQLRTLVYEALGATLSLLELPTPLLEHVEIDNSKSVVYGASALNPPSARRRLLPFAPRLQTVDVYSAPIISTLPGAAYPSLRSLKWFAPGLDIRKTGPCSDYSLSLAELSRAPPSSSSRPRV
ncbi:hypothetical protein EXIGLDRAFT_694324 [Exidia glandulosa HHB12029]|uniref:Uncharacterized protein n=1 Tax=Exidia glandulosa HHB12029 TaxID=1314781 RepID=A0A165NM19_EXIGL|nr:hypothetical protein EXIGLDRAFT_694324 [Exidia glandulosa HHB12029]